MNYYKEWKYFLLTASVAVLVFSVIIRLRFVFSQAAFIDEFPNVSESMSFTRDLFDLPTNYAGLLSDPLKPVFYRLFFGFAIIIINFFHEILSHQFLNLFPSNLILSIQYARLSMLLLNMVCYIIILKEIWKSSPLFTFFLLIFITLNPMLIFNSSIAETGAFIIPISLLFVFYLAKADLHRAKTLLPISVITAMLISVQYYSFIFIIYAIIFLINQAIFSRNGRPLNRDFYKILTNLLIFLILLPILVFLVLNPSYWHNPYYAFMVTFRSIAYPLTKASGVYGLNVFSLGHSVSNAPIYATVYYFVLQVPVVELLFFGFGIGALFYDRLKKKEITYLTMVGYISLLLFAGNTIFTAVFAHFRGTASVSVLLLVPSLIIAAIGVERALTLLFFYFNRYINSSPVKNNKDYSEVPLKLMYERQKTNDNKYHTLSYLVTLCVILLLILPIIYDSTPNFSYANSLGTTIYKSGTNITGSYSGQSDMLIAGYMDSHDIMHRTIISLALTSDLLYYAPNNTYLQFWPTEHPVNSSYLLLHYFSDYLVVDEYYAQLFGNPVQNNATLFPKIVEFSNPESYSILYHIGPLPDINESAIITSFPIKLTGLPRYTVDSRYVYELKINSLLYKDFEFPNLTNVEFSYKNSTQIVPSYLLYGNNYLSNSTIYYLQLTIDTNINNFMYVNIDFSRNVDMNGFYVGANPFLQGIKYAWDDGRYIFSYYKSFANGSNSGYYVLNQNANTTVKFNNGAEFFGEGIGRSYLGSIQQFSVIGSTTMTQIAVGQIPKHANSTVSFTPWTPNGSFPNFGIDIIDGNTYLYVGSYQLELNISNTLSIYLEANSTGFTIIFYECSYNFTHEVYSFSGVFLIPPTIMAPSNQQYFYGGNFPGTIGIENVLSYYT